MKPEDVTAYKKMINQLTGTDKYRQSAVEQQIALARNLSQKITESMMGFPRPSSHTEIVKQIAIREHQRLKELMLPTAGNALSEIIRNLQGSHAFDVARSAANASAESIKALRKLTPDISASFLEMNRRSAAESIAAMTALRDRDRKETLRIAASVTLLNAADSIRPLTALLAEQMKSLEGLQSQFAQSVAQTLKTQFHEFEERNKESFEQFEEATDREFDELETKLTPTNLMKVVQVIAHFIALAAFAIALATYLDDKRQSKVNVTYADQILAALQRMAAKAEQQVSVYYFAERTVPLKEKPDHKAKTLMTLERNDEVRLIERKHKWILVEYDSEFGPIYGWADKKYLKRIR